MHSSSRPDGHNKMLSKWFPMCLASLGTQEHGIAAGWSASVFQLPPPPCTFSQAFQTPVLLVFLPSPPSCSPFPSSLTACVHVLCHGVLGCFSRGRQEAGTALPIHLRAAARQVRPRGVSWPHWLSKLWLSKSSSMTSALLNRGQNVPKMVWWAQTP